MAIKIQKKPRIILIASVEARNASTIIVGIGKYCQRDNPWLISSIHLRKEESHKRLISDIKAYQPDGIIISTAFIIDELIELNLPTIAFYPYRQLDPNLPAIFEDSQATVEMGIEHLRDCGCKHFAYCGYKSGPESEKRAGIFREIAKSSGNENDYFVYMPKWVPVDSFWKKENSLIIEWLKTLPKPIGILTLEDYLAEQILICCNIAGFNVPEQIAVLGSGNTDVICKSCNPTLSSIEFAMEKAGYEICELLNKLMAGEKMKGQNIIIHPEYVVKRTSTDATFIEDPQIAQALKFIRDHITDIKQITDVSEALGINRRSLEYKVRKVLNHSILEEIRHVRVNRTAQLLIDTQLPLSTIAEIVGYSNQDHLWRCFKMEKKISPSQYRKNNIV